METRVFDNENSRNDSDRSDTRPTSLTDEEIREVMVEIRFS